MAASRTSVTRVSYVGSVAAFALAGFTGSAFDHYGVAIAGLIPAFVLTLPSSLMVHPVVALAMPETPVALQVLLWSTVAALVALLQFELARLAVRALRRLRIGWVGAVILVAAVVALTAGLWHVLI